MTIQSATADLTLSSSLIPSTGFVPYSDGILDEITGTIKPTGSSQWAALGGTTWSNWSSYLQSPKAIRWTSPLIDVGEIKYFNLKIETDFDGTLYFDIHVSETGVFQGEETAYRIVDGDYNISAFYGRYVYVTAFVSGNELRRMTITSTSKTNTRKLININTNTLSGSNTNRTLSLSPAVSQIVDMVVEPKAATPYAVNLYVSDTATSEVLIPVVKSKSASAPSFALYGIDNDPRDGIVDITLTTLPRQAMISGNLTLIE